MAIEHVNSSDPNIHESKGVAAAGKNKIFLPDGVGSGSFKDSLTSINGEIAIINNLVGTGVTAAVDGTLTTDTDYIKVTDGWTLHSSSGVTLSIDEAVVSVAGSYFASFWATIDIGLNNNFIGLKSSINNTVPFSLRKVVTQATTNGDIVNVSAAGIIVDLVANDTVSLYVAATKTDTLIVKDAGLVLMLMTPA